MREAARKQITSADENELIRAAQAGDRAALEELVRDRHEMAVTVDLFDPRSGRAEPVHLIMVEQE